MDNQDYVVPSEQQEKLEDILDELRVPSDHKGTQQNADGSWPVHLTTEEIQVVAEFLSTRVKVLNYLERTVEPLQVGKTYRVNPSGSHVVDNGRGQPIRCDVEPFDRPARRRAPDHDSMGPMK